MKFQYFTTRSLLIGLCLIISGCSSQAPVATEVEATSVAEETAVAEETDPQIAEPPNTPAVSSTEAIRLTTPTAPPTPTRDPETPISDEEASRLMYQLSSGSEQKFQGAKGIILAVEDERFISVILNCCVRTNLGW